MRTKLLTSGVFLTILFGYFLYSQDSEPYLYKLKKLNGISFVAPHKPIDSTHIDDARNIHADWVSLMPYAFVGDNSPECRYVKMGEPLDDHHQWWGERPEGVLTCIDLAKNRGMKIMLKPHIWMRRGNYTGDFVLESEKDWELFEKTYHEYLMLYAQIAADKEVEVFCIATEMETMVKERPQFFAGLISDIRKIYSGKLTYAENWDCYSDFPFWNQLDFIGVDAYFPLSEKQNPDLEALKKGWAKHLKGMNRMAGKYQKPILFTEYGYRSCDFSTQKPWETDYSLPPNNDLQARAFESVFESVWQQPWFAGGFVWKWFPLKEKERESRDMFCFRDKPAEAIVSKYYGLTASIK